MTQQRYRFNIVFFNGGAMEKDDDGPVGFKETIKDYTPHLVFFGIFALWLFAWFIGFRPQLLKSITAQPLNDIFLSVNTLFAGLAFFGIIWTSFTQYKDLKESKKLMRETAVANGAMASASERMAAHADEKMVLDLFQTYCSEYFQGVKDRSMNVLIASVRSQEYGAYVVSRFSVASQVTEPDPACFSKFVDIKGWGDWNEFLKNERPDRYKLDELINFFSLLVGISNAKDVIRGCDFSYSWWRPLLWMLAVEQELLYHANEQIRLYSTGRALNRIVKRLDAIYGFKSFRSYAETWAYISAHPKVVSYGLDPKYAEVQRAAEHAAWDSPGSSGNDLFPMSANLTSRAGQSLPMEHASGSAALDTAEGVVLAR
jgi:hypothetical protein